MGNETPLINAGLLNLIVCPLTGVKLEMEGDRLINRMNWTYYPIVDGIPFLDPKYAGQQENVEKSNAL
ncbi:MAG: hypothetical protein LBB29_01170 [Holosporaceae bacterium]|jgi:uncharacterized protein YbaR (Trm112 family)|nr:hypothetical protein [Holosporaceae bacterium]